MGLIETSSVDSIFDCSGLFPRYFDVVVQGGGPNSIYLLGLYDTFKKLEKTGDIRISKYLASDVAAILCVLLCLDVEKPSVMKFCDRMMNDITNDHWKKDLLGVLPHNAYILCSNRVFIYTSVSVYSWLYVYRPLVFSEFRSNRDLVEACVLSLQKPCRVYYAGKEKQLLIQLDKLNDRFDRLVFSPKCLFQFYKTARMAELVQRAKQDAEDLFLQLPSAPHSILQWRDGSFCTKYKMLFCFFFPSVAIMCFLFRKK